MWLQEVMPEHMGKFLILLTETTKLISLIPESLDGRRIEVI